MPPELHKEVENYIDFLLLKAEKETGTGKKLKLSWIGGLKEYRDKYTALELQKKALEWRD